MIRCQNLFRSFLFTSIIAIGIPAWCQEAAPAKIEVYPTSAKLTTSRDWQSMIIQATYPDGITRDVTSEAEFKLADGSFARLEGNVLYPVADGKTEVAITYGGHALTVPLEVQQAEADPPQSPAQSTSIRQLPLQSKFSSGYSQEPSSVFASES